MLPQNYQSSSVNSVKLQDIKLMHCCIFIYYQTKDQEKKLKKHSQDLPGGPVVKNPPAKPRDKTLIPGLGRSHWQLSMHTLEPVLPNKRSNHNEKKACTPQLKSSPHLLQLEKAHKQQRSSSAANK